MSKVLLGVLALFSSLFLSAQTSAPGTLQVTPAALQFTAVAGGGATPAQTLYVLNDTTFQGNVTGQWSGSYTTPLQGTVSMQISFTQSEGIFFGTLSASNGSTQLIYGALSGNVFNFVSFDATGTTNYVNLGTGTLVGNTISGTFTAYTSTATQTDSGTFTITRQGSAPPLVTTLPWTATASVLSGPSGWLVVQPSSGSTTAGSLASTISVSVQSGSLSPGLYSGQILVSSTSAANSPVAVAVLLTVLPASAVVAPQTRPTGLIFIGAGTAAIASQSVQVSTAATSSVQVTATPTTQSGGNWLAVSPPSATLSNSSPITFSVTVSGGLAAGVYRGSVNLTFSDNSASQSVGVLLIVPASGPEPAVKLPVAAACTAGTLLAVDRTLGSNFQGLTSWPTTLEALVVDDCGVLTGSANVLATFSNGDPPVALQSLGGGVYQATWRPVNPAGSVTVTVTASQAPLKQAQVTLLGKITDNPNVAAIFAGGMVSAASYSGLTLPPGGIVSVFGKNLAQTGAAAKLPLPTQLGNLTLTAAGQDLPLFYTSNGQVNAQLPAELNTGTRVAVIARTTVGGNLVFSVPEVITVGPATPGVFSVSQDGKGQGVILDANNRLLDGKQASAIAGQTVVIYCTGLGATVPLVPSGQASPGNPPAQINPTPLVTIGGLSAQVQFAGLTPGLVGLYQINAVIPAGVTGAATTLTITHQGATSNSVTLSVK